MLLLLLLLLFCSSGNESRGAEETTVGVKGLSLSESKGAREGGRKVERVL